jgi:hypothetical protein
MKNLGALNDAAALSSAARRLEPAWEEIAGAECREQFRPLADVKVFSLDIPLDRRIATVYSGFSSISQCPEPATTSSWTLVGNVTHDHGLERAEGLLSAHRHHRHR